MSRYCTPRGALKSGKSKRLSPEEVLGVATVGSGGTTICGRGGAGVAFAGDFRGLGSCIAWHPIFINK